MGMGMMTATLPLTTLVLVLVGRGDDYYSLLVELKKCSETESSEREAAVAGAETLRPQSVELR